MFDVDTVLQAFQGGDVGNEDVVAVPLLLLLQGGQGPGGVGVTDVAGGEAAKKRFGFQLELPDTFVRLGPEALELGLQEVVYARAPGFQRCAELPVVSRQLVGEQFLGVCRFDVFEPLLDLFVEGGDGFAHGSVSASIVGVCILESSQVVRFAGQREIGETAADVLQPLLRVGKLPRVGISSEFR